MAYNQNPKTMTIKNYLFAFFAFFSFAIHAQTEDTTVTSITEFKVETDTLEELTNFDWNIATDMFEANAPGTEIKIVLTYNKKVQFHNVIVDNFEVSVGGKTSELAALIQKSKGLVAKLSEVN